MCTFSLFEIFTPAVPPNKTVTPAATTRKLAAPLMLKFTRVKLYRPGGIVNAAERFAIAALSCACSSGAVGTASSAPPLSPKDSTGVAS
tara:strand:- start:35 stop:301 length:267 start_codon:yes stop_codon:yes gene_type:complete